MGCVPVRPEEPPHGQGLGSLSDGTLLRTLNVNTKKKKKSPKDVYGGHKNIPEGEIEGNWT